MHQRTPRSILSLLACAVAVLMLANCGGGGDDGDDGGGGGGGGGGTRSPYVGATVCQGCHAELTEHWEGTAHAEAVATLTAIGMDSNARCLSCHTTGMGQEGGFVDAATTPNLLNVQCESCHGPGAEHAGDPSEDNIVAVVPADTCGGCHTDAHHPTYEEFQESKHSKGLEDAHSENCLPCHTAEGFVHKLNGPTPPPEEEGRQLGEEATTNVECWACHDPHQAKEGVEGQLRLPTEELCRECHTFRLDQGNNPSSELERRPVHNPQGEVVNATGGYRWDGDTWQPLVLPAGHGPSHSEVTEGQCSICHVHPVEREDPTDVEPNVTGHTFRPNLNACTQSGCHSNLSRQTAPPEFTGDAITDGASEAIIAYWSEAKAEGTAKLNEVKAALDQVDQSALSPAQFRGYLTAKWNYDLCRVDKSEGIHNQAYVFLCLDTALDICAQLPQLPPPT